MNILVTTWTKYNNLGTQLQAYALQRKLILMGHNVATTDDRWVGFDILDEKNKISNIRLYSSLVYSLIKYPFNSKNRKKYSNYEENEENIFDKFKENHIILEQNVNDYRYLNNKYQVFICGSDQIWSPRDEVFSKFYYLDFVESRNTKISYAPSMGQSVCSAEYKSILKPLINNLDKISVREEQGKKILQTITNKNIDVVMDPTLLLEKEQWDKITAKRLEKEKYVFCYFLGENLWYREYAKEIAKKYNLKLCIQSVLEIDKNNPNLITNDVGPSEFLSYIKNAEYIITDSYHGSIFSLIFKKNFVSVKRFKDDNKKISQNSRLHNLFEIIDLKDRFIDEDNIVDFYNKKINYKSVESKLDIKIKESVKFLEEGIKSGNGDKIVSSMCTGCNACKVACPVDAIEIIEDQYGEGHATINKEKCINCGLCKNICPNNKPIKLSKIKSCYGVTNKNEDEVIKSSSCGVAHELSKMIINDGGVVYGCINNQMHIEHVRVDNIKMLDKLKGSKYTKSDLNNIFINIKKDLKNKKVLFTGTPCQVAGLKAYLKKDYDNLFLVDIACHGVTDQKNFNEYYKSISSNAADVTFRDKQKYYMTFFDKENNIIYKKYKDEDPYLYAFLNNISLRENCYQCLYANNDRVGDITIGDFWGLDNEKHHSIVLVNNSKGDEIFKKLSNLNVKKYNIIDSISKNDALVHPQGKSEYRNEYNIGLKQNFMYSLKHINIKKIMKNEHNPILIKKIKSKFKIKLEIIENDLKKSKEKHK